MSTLFWQLIIWYTMHNLELTLQHDIYRINRKTQKKFENRRKNNFNKN